MILPLLATLVLQFAPPGVLLFVDPGEPATEAAVLAQACPMLKKAEVPLPVPYVVVRMVKAGEGPTLIPGPVVLEGLIRACPP